MSQGRTLKKLEENLKDAYNMMVMEDVSEDHIITDEDSSDDTEKAEALKQMATASEAWMAYRDQLQIGVIAIVSVVPQ